MYVHVVEVIISSIMCVIQMEECSLVNHINHVLT